MCLIDEAQQWSESAAVYLISRLRTEAKMKPRMKMTCNPDAASFLRRWLDEAGYLDENNLGIPKPEMDGKMKWFVRQGNEMIWGDSEQELIDKFGKDCGAMSFVFYAATCEDNPVLLDRDPSYLSKLKSLPRVEMLRLLKGAWHAKEEAAGLFKKEWVTMIDKFELPEPQAEARSWDLAASIPSEIYPDPDHTVGLKGLRDDSGCIFVTDMVRLRARPAEVRRVIMETGFNDGLHVGITIPRDAGAAGKDAAERLTADLMAEGLVVKQKPSQGKGKAKRFEPVSALAENRMIYVVKGEWNKVFFDELENFGSGRGHDDVVDALSDLVMELITKRVDKPVTLPSINAKTLLHDHRARIR